MRGRAIFDCVGSDSSELTFSKGAILLDVSPDAEEAGWFHGFLNGQEGLFPGNHVVFEVVPVVPVLPPRPTVDVTSQIQLSSVGKRKPPPPPVKKDVEIDWKQIGNQMQPQKPIIPVRYHTLFKQLDTTRRGYLYNSEVQEVWSKSQLEAYELGQIWDLLRHRVLNSMQTTDENEFCLGTYLIDEVLRGNQIPLIRPAGA